MISQLQSIPSHTTVKADPMMETAPSVASSIGRLVQVGLALCLLPALLIVLVVGALGMLILASTRIFPSIVSCEASDPQEPIGLESFRA